MKQKLKHEKKKTRRVICPTEPHERNPNTLKFAEREDCADWAKHVTEKARTIKKQTKSDVAGASIEVVSSSTDKKQLLATYILN